jgi:hypothetical protein
MEIAFSIRLICADRVIVGEEGDDTQGHEQEVISDTLLVLLDFLAYFQQNHSQPYDVVTSATIDPFTERLNDRLAGNSVTITIRQPFDWNKCQIPQTGASIPPTVDGLTLYNFCDPSVIARLTDEQVACLIAQYNEPCEDATITINSAPFAGVPSGGSLNVPVVNGGDNPVGSEQGGEWVIGNSEVFINAVQVADIVAEDPANLAVELDGVPSGTWNAGTQTWEVTSTPCADGTVNITNTDSDPIATVTVASGGVEPYVIPNVSWTDSDGSAESTPYGDAIVCTPIPPVTYPTTAALIKTGQTVSYQSGDDGDFEAGRNASFLVLAENNPFGNTNRFTDLVGGQTYAANIVIDWSTFEKSTGKVLMWERTRQGIVNWTTAVTNSRALTYNGWTNWRLPNVTEGLSLFNYGVLSNPLNYSPFTTNALDGYYWTGTTNPSNTATALLMGMAVWASVVSTKTNAVRWIAVRTGNISELTIP